MELPAMKADVSEDHALALSRACTALWVATLSLMAAFMQTSAPAHRYLIARKIARNLATLHEEECFTPDCRARFAKLSQRWTEKADQLGRREDQPRGGIGFLQPLWKAP
jgi:hypothetical protein